MNNQHKKSALLDISQLMSLSHFSTQFSSLADDYLFAHLKYAGSHAQKQDIPMRINGICIIHCLRGEIDCEINLEKQTLKSGSIMSIGPEKLFRFIKAEPSCDICILVISASFMRNINLDVNFFSNVNLSPLENPIVNLSESESEILSRYFALIHSHTDITQNINEVLVRSISRSLVGALLQQLILFFSIHYASQQDDDSVMLKPVNRQILYVKQFIKLVHQHYRNNRNVSYYADKLCISPKYLSLIIKENTGTTAAKWIDDFVILEAKNLLRYSGLNVQQVAYELNFSNQSTFGKYFKHLTGMSPTEFQRF